MKILNLYAGIGGNRKLWGNEHKITAIENNPEIANIYQDFFPDDTVVVGDAHQYLLDHHKEFDFIWSSPPCQSHSRLNTCAINTPKFPDMMLYEEILFLGNNYYKGKWVVENVIPYYEPLVQPKQKMDRHLFWANFTIHKKEYKKEISIKFQKVSGRFGINLRKYKISNKRQILRNLVNPKVGLDILNYAIERIDNSKTKQASIFERIT